MENNNIKERKKTKREATLLDRNQQLSEGLGSKNKMQCCFKQGWRNIFCFLVPDSGTDEKQSRSCDRTGLIEGLGIK